MLILLLKTHFSTFFKIAFCFKFVAVSSEQQYPQVSYISFVKVISRLIRLKFCRYIPIWYLHICILEMSKSVIRKLFSIFQFLCLSLCIIVFLFSYFSLQNNIYECKRRRKFWVKRQVTDSTNIEHWLLTRQKLSGKFIFKICTYYQFLIYVNLFLTRM